MSVTGDRRSSSSIYDLLLLRCRIREYSLRAGMVHPTELDWMVKTLDRVGEDLYGSAWSKHEGA